RRNHAGDCDRQTDLARGTRHDSAVGRRLGIQPWADRMKLERRRPRLLAYVGRWGRARRWLAPNAQRALDVGCNTGYGSAALAARQSDGRWVGGLERDLGL